MNHVNYENPPFSLHYKPTYDFRLVRDESGNISVRYYDIDCAAIIKDHGSVEDWSLDNLLKAGVDPSFPIHTSPNARIDSFGELSTFEDIADALLGDPNPIEEPSNE